MNSGKVWIVGIAFLAVLGCGGSGHHEEPGPTAAAEPAPPVQPTPDEQVAALEQDCAEAAEVIAARQAEASLYDRLGGREAIHSVVVDVVRRHHENPTIVHLLDGVEDAHLIEQVTDFIAAASGGDVTYEGRDMVTAHAHLQLTNEHFLAAGGDVEAALAAGGVGEGEIQELMCMFVSLRPEVVHAGNAGDV